MILSVLTLQGRWLVVAFSFSDYFARYQGHMTRGFPYGTGDQNWPVSYLRGFVLLLLVVLY